MNPGYLHPRFRAELPPSGLPTAFGIVTAFNPDGKSSARAANAARNARLQQVLIDEGLAHFPVTGGSADFTHAEPGFGIIASKHRCLELGREFRQEAIFWVEKGIVYLCGCTAAADIHLGDWVDLAEP